MFSFDKVQTIQKCQAFLAVLGGGGGGGFAPTASPWAAVAGAASDMIGGFLPTPPEYSGDKGAITAGLDSAYDSISDAAMNFGPVGMIVGGAMKVNGLLNKGMKNLGAGTDGMTTADAILGSNFLGPMGWINGWTGKKADTYLKDELIWGHAANAYTGLEGQADWASSHSGKKYGGISRGAMYDANARIHQAGRMLNTLGSIVGQKAMSDQLLANLTLMGVNSYAQSLQGGYDLGLMRAAKSGMKLLTAKRVASRYKMNDVSFTEDDLKGFEFVNFFKKGGKLKPAFKDWVKTVNPLYLSDNYDLELAYKHLPMELLEKWRMAVNSRNPEFYMNFLNIDGTYPYHLTSVVQLPNGDYAFLKKGKEDINPELIGELDSYRSGENGLKDTHDLVFNDEENRYYYRKWHAPLTKEFKDGGKMNVIPEGALHARKHHMEDDENITKKSIPIVNDKEGGEIELLAEIECNEIIFIKEVTELLEKLAKIYYDENSTQAEKDEASIKAGKLLAKEIMENTDDRTGLIESVE